MFIVVRAALLFALVFGFSKSLFLPQQLHHPAGVKLIISLLQHNEFVTFRSFFDASSVNDPAVIGKRNFVYLCASLKSNWYAVNINNGHGKIGFLFWRLRGLTSHL